MSNPIVVTCSTHAPWNENAEDQEAEQAPKQAGLAAAEVEQQQPDQKGDTHSRSPLGAGCSGASSAPTARVGALKASGGYALFLGDDLAHRPMLAERPALPNC